jgi:two-component system, NarL family, nitrate/nitrite response regulator NarL
MFVESLAVVLTAQGWTVCALALTPGDAEQAVLEHRPDIAVLDLGFPAAASLAVARALHDRAPGTGLVALTSAAGGASLDAARDAASEARVGGLASKDADLGQIIAAIRRVRRSEVMAEPNSLVEAVVPAGRRPPQDDLIERFLTEREREVLGCLVRGQSTGTVAADLGITANTARSHIQSTLNKLGVHSRVEAAALAVRTGLLHA